MSKIRVLTAAALFDGHDVSINIFRRLLQMRGAEVIHLGHNRSVSEVVTVAVQEDVDAVLVSSYQGGHNEYFKYVADLLKENDAGHILIFGGGGGVMLPNEIEELEKYGIERIYHATDGQQIGIDGIADDIINRVETAKKGKFAPEIEINEDIVKNNSVAGHLSIAQQLSYFENYAGDENQLHSLREIYSKYDKKQSLVLGFTGTGGSGKSSLIDEIIGRFIHFTDNVNIGILAIDPTKSRTGGALLGDRIRYNQIYNDRVYFRSFATRHSASEISTSISDSINVMKSCGFDIIIIETSGIGQGDSRIADVSDYSIYVMTAEFGAPSQLEKIDMLDIADFIVINKFEKRGSEDALREVMLNRLRNKSVKTDPTMPLEELDIQVYPTSSNQFNNNGVNRLFVDLLNLLNEEIGGDYSPHSEFIDKLPVKLERDFGLIDNKQINYLSDIADAVRNYHKELNKEAGRASDAFALKG